MSINSKDKMHIEHLDKKLKRIFAIKPHSFIFIKVTNTQQYDHVLCQLQLASVEFERTFASIKIQDDEDIMTQITESDEECLLIQVDPLIENSLKRLDFLRERLYNSGKLLIFVLYINQYDTLLRDYPDLYEYSTLNFDYSTSVLVPFTLIFSNDSFSGDRKKLKESVDHFSTRLSDVKDKDYLYNIFLGIKKLRTMRIKASELHILDAMISPLYKEMNSFEDKQIVQLLFDYIDLLCMKGEYSKAQTNLEKLYANLEQDTDKAYTIYYIYNIILLSNDDSSEWGFYVCMRTCRILMMIFVYNGNKNDLMKAACINQKRVQLLKGRKYLSDDLRAEVCNDNIIIQYLLDNDVKLCISDIDYMKYLTISDDLLFLYYYNKAILYLLDDDYQNALSLCEKRLKKYQSSPILPGMHYYRICLIQNWIKGMYYRKLNEAIAQNVLILQKHRNVFSENHYSIAEIHFCNAILYQELGETEKSQHCAEKANNILKQNPSKRLARLKGLVQDFMNDESTAYN